MVDLDLHRFSRASVAVARAAHQVRVASLSYAQAAPSEKQEAGRRVGKANAEAQRKLDVWVEVAREVGALDE